MRPDTAWPLNVPVLTDGVVTLRAHAADDVDRIIELSTDPEMLRWTPIFSPYRRADAQAYAMVMVPRTWDQGIGMVWAIEYEGRFVGHVDISGSGSVVDLGYSLHPDARGKGLMKRAVTLAVDHAFAEGKQVIRGSCTVGNIASLRVAHACGFSMDALAPDRLDLHGTIHDAWLVSRRADDPPGPQTVWRTTAFETERFRMRPLRESDDERIRETLDDPISRKYLFERPSPLNLSAATAERTRKWWTAARGETCTWVVTEKDDDTYLADISLFKIDPTTGAEIGFYTHPDARGSGVLSETMPAAVRHCFDVLGIRRLTLLAASSNTGSMKLAQASGFRCYGTQELAALSDGVYEDLVGFELLREPFTP
ncbi:GNAT family N-acetyltransferase [Gordonia sp. CPCC 205515]|uniref:GNAT family N-acetyltransferase n=1 Tax=Gordonia sp. CPCC 205515 TaxID=3140791 RepID=UPI003AF3C52D